MSKRISAFSGRKFSKGGKAGRGPGRSGRNAETNPGSGGRSRPMKGWGLASGGPAGKGPRDGGYEDWERGNPA